MLPLSSASQRLVGNQLTIPISDFSLEDLRDDCFLAKAPKKKSQLQD
jgi:hypothetical protein